MVAVLRKQYWSSKRGGHIAKPGTPVTRISARISVRVGAQIRLAAALSCKLRRTDRSVWSRRRIRL